MPLPDSDRASSPAETLTAETAPQPAQTWGRIARRIFSRTTDLLAIAIVLVGGLTLGRQVLQWWSEAPPAVLPVAESSSSYFADQGEPFYIEFGGHPVELARQMVEGDASTATDLLFDRCRVSLGQAALPSAPADARELRLLELLGQREPQLAQGEAWKLYAIPGGVVTVVGVRTFPALRAPSPIIRETHAAPPVPRVVCWGIAFPVGSNLWTTYVFQPSFGRESNATSRFPLPPGCRTSLKIRTVADEQLIGIHGPGEPDIWTKQFTNLLTTEGWQTAGWTALDNHWHARFSRNDEAAEIRLNRSAPGELSGLISITTGTAVNSLTTDNTPEE